MMTVDTDGNPTSESAEEAQELFKHLRGQMQNSDPGGKGKKNQQDKKDPQEPKSTVQERQEAHDFWMNSLLKFNKFMGFKIFAEGFTETFPAKVKTPILKFVNKESAIQFGNPEISNQVSHATRHLDLMLKK